jgi:hypothetical protein
LTSAASASSFSLLRAMSSSVPPAAPIWRAACSPIPDEAPVISTTLSRTALSIEPLRGPGRSGRIASEFIRFAASRAAR